MLLICRFCVCRLCHDYNGAWWQWSVTMLQAMFAAYTANYLLKLIWVLANNRHFILFVKYSQMKYCLKIKEIQLQVELNGYQQQSFLWWGGDVVVHHSGNAGVGATLMMQTDDEDDGWSYALLMLVKRHTSPPWHCCCGGGWCSSWWGVVQKWRGKYWRTTSNVPPGVCSCSWPSYTKVKSNHPVADCPDGYLFKPLLALAAECKKVVKYSHNRHACKAIYRKAIYTAGQKMLVQVTTTRWGSSFIGMDRCLFAAVRKVLINWSLAGICDRECCTEGRATSCCWHFYQQVVCCVAREARQLQFWCLWMQQLCSISETRCPWQRSTEPFWHSCQHWLLQWNE